MTPITDDHLISCAEPGCGFVRRWWAGPHCPSHAPAPDPEETPTAMPSRTELHHIEGDAA